MPSTLPLWSVVLCDARGRMVQQLDTVASFSVSRIANGVGWGRLIMPPSFNTALVKLDSMIEFWYRPIGAVQPIWFNTYFVRKFEYGEDGSGQDTLVLSGPDIMDVLRRRIVAYAAGNAKAQQTDNRDDMIKSVASENLAGDATDTARSIAALGFSVGGDLAAATSATHGFAWRNCLNVMQDIADAARSVPEDLYFWIDYAAGTTAALAFKTALGQPGVDRTSGAATTIFGKEWGNLYSPLLTFDYTEEANYIYAGGQGEGAERQVKEAYDLTRTGASAWNRREYFYDCRNMTTTAAIQAAAYVALSERRPRVRFAGRLGDTNQTRYGLHWQWGDKVNVTYRNYQFDAVIKSVQINVTEAGQTIEARVESDDTLTVGSKVGE